MPHSISTRLSISIIFIVNVHLFLQQTFTVCLDTGHSNKGESKNMIPKFSNFLGTHIMVDKVQIIEKQVNSFTKQYQVLESTRKALMEEDITMMINVTTTDKRWPWMLTDLPGGVWVGGACQKYLTKKETK